MGTTRTGLMAVLVRGARRTTQVARRAAGFGIEIGMAAGAAAKSPAIMGVWVLLALMVSGPAQAQLAPQQTGEAGGGPLVSLNGPHGAAGLRHAVRDAGSDRVIMILASHPDDRWTLPAALFRFGLGHEVHVVLATRGEGGQNRVGAEIGNALGSIRTLEALRSAARLDVRLSFLDLPDLGYCRTGAEALEQWGAARTMERLVASIRRIQPHVIVTPHHFGDDHGHDQALLAALPSAVGKIWPSTAPGEVTPPQRPRLFRPITPEQPRAGSLAFAVDLVDPANGRTFLELAYDALNEEHRSQQPLPPMREHFRTILRDGGVAGSTLYLECFGEEGRTPAALCQGMPDVLDRLGAGDYLPPEELADLTVQLQEGLEQDLGDLPRLVQRAARLDRVLERLIPEATRRGDGEVLRGLKSRRRGLGRLLTAALGLRVLVQYPLGPTAVTDEELPLRIHLHNGDAAAVRGLVLRAARGGTLSLGPATDRSQELGRRATAVLPGAFAVAAEPEPEPPGSPTGVGSIWPLALEVACTVADRELRIEVPLKVPVLPAVELEIAPPKLLIKPDMADRELLFSVTVKRNSRYPIRGRLLVNAPPGIRARTRFGQDSMVMLDVGRVQSVPYRLRLPEGYDAPLSLLQARFNDRDLKIPVQLVDAVVPNGLHVGLVKGVDNGARDVLLGMGVRVTPLEDVDLTTRDLSGFDCILVDIRALAVRERARAAMGILLRFAAQPGKRLTVLYHKDAEFNPDTAGFEGAPFQPFRIGKGRVTEPDAAVRPLVPDHPLLRLPNVIRAEDWDGWVQERGLYFVEQFDPERYTALLSMADDGLPRQTGSLVHCRTGGGEFVYCGLSLFRQLDVSHPGAIRLLVNLVTPAPVR